MGYEQLQRNLAILDTVLTRIGFTIPTEAPVASQLDLARRFLTDMAASPEDAIRRSQNIEFLVWYRAMLAVNMLCEAVAELERFPKDILVNLIRLATMTDLSQDFEQSQSKNYLYEMQVGAWFHKAGFHVDFCEPDIQVSGNGLTQVLGVACKYPSSEKRINKNISKGYEQIAGQNLRGFVAIAMDLLECAGMTRFVQLPDDLKEVERTMASRLGQRAEQILNSRSGQRNTVPLDGAMFTLRMTGVWGKPAGLLTAGHITCQVDKDNPIFDDFVLLITKTVKSLNS